MKNILTPLISYGYAFLYIYAACSKLIDFETFKVQLGQSPLLSAFADGVAFGVPVIEIGIAILLLMPQFRYIGLLGAYSLMVMFTGYIYIILNYSDFIPCSCGGILSNMSWTEHLLFNGSFVLLAIIALIVFNKKPIKRTIYKLLIGFLLSTGTVVLLFLLSEEKMHRNNSFIRRYPHHPITMIKGIPLKYNSYYIAGFEKGKIYLGNSTAPLHLVSVDTSLKRKEPIRIQITDSKDYPFAAIQVKINPPYFYIVDGAIPIIYKGNTTNWKATLLTKNTSTFSLLEPTNKDSFVVRSNETTTREHVLGTINKTNRYELKKKNKVLQKKIDGIFDTDGMLIYNKELDKVIYSYYYRNTFIVADTDLKRTHLEKTIDTVRQLPLEFVYLPNKEKKLAKQPKMINKYATSAGKYLFIKSDRLGKYESEEIAKQASIIDVYDLEKQTYEFSFYLYHYKNEEIKTFKIYNNLVVGLTENYLITSELKPKYFKL